MCADNINIIVKDPITLEAHPGIARSVSNRIVVTMIIPANVTTPDIKESNNVLSNMISIYTDTALNPSKIKAPKFIFALPFILFPLSEDIFDILNFERSIVAGRWFHKLSR